MIVVVDELIVEVISVYALPKLDLLTSLSLDLMKHIEANLC